jgi:hypothetical protein
MHSTRLILSHTGISCLDRPDAHRIHGSIRKSGRRAWLPGQVSLVSGAVPDVDRVAGQRTSPSCGGRTSGLARWRGAWTRTGANSRMTTLSSLREVRQRQARPTARCPFRRPISCRSHCRRLSFLSLTVETDIRPKTTRQLTGTIVQLVCTFLPFFRGRHLHVYFSRHDVALGTNPCPIYALRHSHTKFSF